MLSCFYLVMVPYKKKFCKMQKHLKLRALLYLQDCKKKQILFIVQWMFLFYLLYERVLALFYWKHNIMDYLVWQVTLCLEKYVFQTHFIHWGFRSQFQNGASYY